MGWDDFEPDSLNDLDGDGDYDWEDRLIEDAIIEVGWRAEQGLLTDEEYSLFGLDKPVKRPNAQPDFTPSHQTGGCTGALSIFFIALLVIVMLLLAISG